MQRRPLQLRVLALHDHDAHPWLGVLVVGIDSEVEVEVVRLVVEDRVGADESSAFEVAAVGVPCGVDGVELRRVVAVVEVVGNAVLDEEELVCVADVVAHLVIGVT